MHRSNCRIIGVKGSCRSALSLKARIALMALVAGCRGGAPEPPTDLHPVSGVVLLSGGQPLTSGGMIEFRSPQDSKVRSISTLDSAGRFTLSSRVGATSFPGALAGVYKVTVYPQGPRYIEPIEYV